MSPVTVKLDVVLSHFVGKETVQLDQDQLAGPVTVQHVLDKLDVPSGMVGVIVCDGRILDAHSELTAPCLVEMFGMYSGG